MLAWVVAVLALELALVALLAAFVADVEALLALVDAELAELAALVAEVLAALALFDALVAEVAAAVALLLALVACVLAVLAEPAAAVAELAALVAEVLAFDAWVLAVEAELAAFVAEVEAWLALVAAAVADEAAAVADAPAAAASTRRNHLAASVLVLMGWAPDDVCCTRHCQMLLVLVSFTMSRTKYMRLAAQFPRFVPSVSPSVGLPWASNARLLPARSAARGSVMLMLVGSVCGALSARSTASAFCCAKMVC